MPLQDDLRAQVTGMFDALDAAKARRAERGLASAGRMTLKQRAEDLYGLDPDVKRSAFLPVGSKDGRMVPAFPEMITDVMKSALLPGHVMQGGEYDLGDVAQMGIDVAGTAGVTGLLNPQKGDVLGMFAGSKALTADKTMMKAAQDMAEKGASRDEIWKSTGWFKDVDGHWKFEIDDSGASATGKAWRESGSAEGNYGDIVAHQKLIEAYPDIAGIGTRAEYSPAFSDVGGYTPAQSRLQEEIFAKGSGRDQNSTLNTLLHEGQHSIQRREGFAPGGTQSMARDILWDDVIRLVSSKKDELEKMYAALPPEYQRQWDMYSQLGGKRRIEMADKMAKDEMLAPVLATSRDLVSAREKMINGPDPDEAYNTYRRLAGEAEARNVENRRRLTPEARRLAPPWKTLDVPESDLIVRGGAPAGPMASIQRGGLPMDDGKKFTLTNPDVFGRADDVAELLRGVAPNTNVTVSRSNAPGGKSAYVKFNYKPEGSRFYTTGEVRVSDHGIGDKRLGDYAGIVDMSKEFDATEILERARQAIKRVDVKTSGLPMDEASRMARAREMGFDSSTDWYRGVDGDHKLRWSSMWTNDPAEAAEFAKGGALTNAGNNPIVMRGITRGKKGRNIDTEIMDELKDGGNIDKLAADIMADEGLDFVEFYHPPIAGSDDHLVRVIRDPKNVRLKHAAFDPAKADSADLLAMNGNPALAALMAHDPETSERKPVPMTLEQLRQYYKAGGS